MDTTNGVVRFQTNIAQIVCLAYDEPKQVKSNFGGDQCMFSLADGRKMFVDPIVAEKIRTAGVRASEPFAICKKEVQRGTRKLVEWQIEPMPPEEPEQDSPSAPQVAPSNGTSRNPQQPNRTAPAPQMYAGNGMTLEEANTAMLVRTGKAALDAMLEVEGYAREKGIHGFTLGPDNQQRIWMTLYIQCARNGGR